MVSAMANNSLSQAKTPPLPAQPPPPPPPPSPVRAVNVDLDSVAGSHSNPHRCAISHCRRLCTGAHSLACTCTWPSPQSFRSVPAASLANANVSTPVKRTSPPESSHAAWSALFNANVADARSSRLPTNGALGLLQPSSLGGGTASNTATQWSPADATVRRAATTYADASRSDPAAPPSLPQNHFALWQRTSISPKEKTQNESLRPGWLPPDTLPPSRRAGGRRRTSTPCSCRCPETAQEWIVPPQKCERRQPTASASARPPWQSPTTRTLSRNGAAAASNDAVSPIPFARFAAWCERRRRCFQPAQ
jgi:hypothetical protein